METAPELSHAPWTEAQIWALSRRQGLDNLHPYMKDGFYLVPTPEGWRMPGGDVVQTWAHIEDVDLDRVCPPHEAQIEAGWTKPPQGELKIAEFTEHRNCSKARFDRSVGRALRLQNLGAEDIHVWYDENEDYMHIDFTMHGSRYVTRSYKVIAIEKDGCNDFVHTKSVQHEHQLFDFFEQRRHIRWWVPATPTKKS